MTLPSVSTALVLSMGIGLFEAAAMFFGSGVFLSMMGISMVSGTCLGQTLQVKLHVSMGLNHMLG